LNISLRWLALHPNWALAFFVLAALGPFLSKPFNMDDPLFIWAARHIAAHPGNPYGFDVNWYGSVSPMWEVTKNPPLACYFLALAGGVLGWTEIALHAAFLLPALAVILGTHRLARYFCGQPMLAAFVTLLTPVFLVSSTTVMCDVLMLAFWVWAVVFWVEGTRKESLWRLVCAALLIALAALTKYYGACLIPLLAAYSILRNRRVGPWSVCLLIPLAALCAYAWITRTLYGHALLSDAANYATIPKGSTALVSSKLGAGLTALSFSGGGMAAATFFAPLVWRLRQLTMIVAGAGLLAVALLLGGSVLKDYGPILGSSRLLIEAQVVFWAIGGAGVLALAISDVVHQRDADSCLLALWVIGTFLFAAFFNWTVNGRTILPMAPAVGLLLARRLEQIALPGVNLWSRGVVAGLLSGGLIAFLVARADFLFAVAVRDSAQLTYSKFARGPERFWFQGHWGFQYYMAALGANALDVEHSLLQRGDLIATPQNNANFSPLGPDLVVLRELITVAGPQWLTTMSGEVGAGFYASLRGPLPFAFGLVPPERVVVCFVDPLTPPSRP
jgi:4-amino-4-deoxy-L-arabinose transferase-like glycosyltransferase